MLCNFELKFYRLTCDWVPKILRKFKVGLTPLKGITCHIKWGEKSHFA